MQAHKGGVSTFMDALTLSPPPFLFPHSFPSFESLAVFAIPVVALHPLRLIRCRRETRILPGGRFPMDLPGKGNYGTDEAVPGHHSARNLQRSALVLKCRRENPPRRNPKPGP